MAIRFLKPTRPALLLGSILLLALILRLHHLGWALPHTYEEARPLHVAFSMWGWERGVDVTLNPGVFHYPSLMFYVHFVTQGLVFLLLRAAGSIHSLTDWLAMYLVDPSAIYKASRAVTALFGVATVWAAWRLGALISGRAAGLLAALFVAVNGFHVTSSQRIDVDVPLAFFVTLALSAMVKIAREPTRRDYVVAAVATGLAASTKYTGFLLLAPLVVAHLLGASRHRHHALSLALGIVAVTFAVTSPFVFIDFRQFWHDFSYERAHMAEGHFGLATTPSWLAYARGLATRVVGVPALLAALTGIWICIRRNKRSVIAPLVFLAVYLVIISSWKMRADRYLLPVLPVVLVFAGILIARLLRMPGRVRHAIAWVLVSAVLVLSFVDRSRTAAAMQSDARTDATDWILRYVPSGSFVLSEHYGPELLAPPRLMQLEPALRNEVLDRIDDAPIIAVQRLPMTQVHPEDVAPYYDIDLYPYADYVITSSSVRGRYEREPDRFPEQMRFYRYLDEHMRVVEEFAPVRGDGVRLTLYTRGNEKPFAAQPSFPPPPALPRGAGSASQQASFYYELATDFEFFGILHEAYVCYIRALDRGPDDRALFLQCAVGAVRTLISTDQYDTALGVLDRLMATAPDDDARHQLAGMKDQVRTMKP